MNNIVFFFCCLFIFCFIVWRTSTSTNIQFHFSRNTGLFRPQESVNIDWVTFVDNYRHIGRTTKIPFSFTKTFPRPRNQVNKRWHWFKHHFTFERLLPSWTISQNDFPYIDDDHVDDEALFGEIAFQLLQLICNSAKAANNVTQLQPLHIQKDLMHHHHHHHPDQALIITTATTSTITTKRITTKSPLSSPSSSTWHNPCQTTKHYKRREILE